MKKRRLRDLVAGVVSSDSDAEADSDDGGAAAPRAADRPLRQDVTMPGAAKRPRLRTTAPAAAKPVPRPPPPQLVPAALAPLSLPLNKARIEQTKQRLQAARAQPADTSVAAAPAPAFGQLRALVQGSPSRPRFRAASARAAVPPKPALQVAGSSSENLFVRAVLAADVEKLLQPCAALFFCARMLASACRALPPLATRLPVTVTCLA